MAAVRSNHHHLFLFLFSTLSLSLLPQPCFSVVPPSDIQALLKLKQSITDADRTLPSWVPNVSPCGNWAGVVCFKDIITGLHLSDMGLTGTIDVDALSQIRGLRTLSFVNNSFTGPIPDFHKLGVIKALLLSENKFSGPIPPEFFNQLGSLKKVWINNNNFSGEIPDSLAGLDLLKELHLESNQFSGLIPNLMQDLTSFDVSNNNLEGTIPDALSKKFGANAFGGNPKLCGKPLDKACEGYTLPSFSQNGSGPSWGVKVILILLGAVIVGVVVVFLRARQRRNGDMGVMGRTYSTESVVQVHVPSSNHRVASEPDSETASVGKKGGGGGGSVGGGGGGGGGGESRRGRSGSTGIGDIVMVNDEKGVFGMQDLMKAAAEVLGNGGLGSAYKAAMANGLSVVVKRMRELNKVGKDVFDAEMRQFGRLRHSNIMGPLAYHYRREEKLFVTEYMPKGSLLYVLHGDRGLNHAGLNWPTRLKIVKGVARGLGFLYSEFSTYDLPHGNLKSSNVLLADDYEPLLSDFAFHPLINPTAAVQTMFAYKSPDYTQYQKVSQKTDVYCLGIIILEIITGKFPSQYHSNGKGGTDVVQWVLTAISERREAELIDPDLQAEANNSLNQMLQLLQIGAACTESNPEQRLSMKEAIRRIEELQV